MNSTFFLMLIGSIALIVIAHRHKNTTKTVKKPIQQPKTIKSFKEKIEKHKNNNKPIKKYEKIT